MRPSCQGPPEQRLYRANLRREDQGHDYRLRDRPENGGCSLSDTPVPGHVIGRGHGDRRPYSRWAEVDGPLPGRACWPGRQQVQLGIKSTDEFRLDVDDVP